MARKIIKRFILDTSNVSIDGDTRSFTIVGDTGAVFSLEILNEDTTPTYYNFATQTFSTTKASLRNITLNGNQYKGFIKFPVVGDADHYDIRLFAEHGYDTFHAPYNEVRFPDGSIDINSSTGSNSSLLMKKIYQYANTTITLSAVSPNSVTEWGSVSITTDSVTGVRFGTLAKTSFSVVATAASARSIRINNQPDENSLTAYVERNIGSAEAIVNEDIYPAVSNTDTVDGAITGGGSTVKVVMDTNVADKMAVGDKITAAVATDTVDGAVTSGTVVTMDNNVAGKMAIGDRITSSSTNVVNDALFNKQIITVASFVDGEAKQFNLSTALAIVDGATLTFSPKCNRSLTTVAVLNPDTDNVKEFSMSQNVGLVDGVTLSFSNQMNYQWPADNIDKIQSGMSVLGTNVTSSTSVGEYEDTITLFANTENERIVTKNRSLSTVTKNQTPTVTKGLVTAQPGNIIFDKQQKLVLASDTITINGYGLDTISTLSGYDIMFTDLKIALTPVTTTTTAASVSSTSVVLAARDGILNGTSTVSGIGIDSSSAVPTVSSGASATGAGTVVLSAAQTLESGITLTFGGAGKVATITGNIEVLKAGTSNQTLRFDIDKLLTSA